ncbi:alanine dehydrogenase [Agromyces aerolatus]|uniref:alanine dehydrogenase n=1 Tax=Agromyces sp. LY-1074 TaxID=3074080 RepID=UPI00285A1288|nr:MULTISPECIES: alanine dehydrogenase [unclassified Agromyces]MDR5699778.1 alanine dehydrogenase [Agromyces sp. LY-1074]MDR5706074.1 alanine dehydrogenase [Agromyces sp. LY-1358]
MRIGVPAEIKNNEFRVAMTPAGAHALTLRGHTVEIQAGAGAGAGYTDAEYREAGATIVANAEAAWANELVLKVKEPIESEYGFLREDLTLFTYLHLAADLPLTRAILQSGVTAIAYETVQLADRSLPLLTPMSEVAGRLAPQVGAASLLASKGGRGVLLAGVPGTAPAKVVVIGGGVAGEQAAATALGLGADVTVFDISLPKLRELDARYEHRIKTLASSPYEIARQVKDADLVVGAVLVPGAAAPKVVTDEMVASMKPGAVLVDIAIDQGGCFEGSRPTTHAEPTYPVHDAIFYCVANMPGAVPATSTPALTNATLPYATKIADLGWQAALAEDAALAKGLNATAGRLTNEGVAKAHGLELSHA